MRWRLKGFVLVCLGVVGSLILGVLSSRAQKKAAIPFPTGYRHWTLAKTMVIYGNQHPLFNQFGGLHNVYANDLGVVSLKQGRPTPTGQFSFLTFLTSALRRARSRQEAGSSSP